MRALVVNPPASGLRMERVPDPTPGPDEVKVRVLEGGVCGTDREIVAGRYGSPPPGRKDLVLGHENFGKVVEVGRSVQDLRVGDEVVATVRRGCGVCRFCRTQRSDFCETGMFTERGIKGRDGYFAEFYVDRPEYLVRIPRVHRLTAVLLEPLSVAEKAVQQARRVLDRTEGTTGTLPGRPRTALVVGTGAMGMLSVFVLAHEGFEVTAVDTYVEKNPASSLLSTVGVRYRDASAGLSVLGAERFDLVLEATGSAPLDFELATLLAPNGCLLLLGLPADDHRPFPVPGADLVRRLVLQNQAIVGSVNASRRYFAQGLRHLTLFRRRWGTVAEQLVTERLPWTDFASVVNGRRPAGIKWVLTIGG